MFLGKCFEGRTGPISKGRAYYYDCELLTRIGNYRKGSKFSKISFFVNRGVLSFYKDSRFFGSIVVGPKFYSKKVA